MPNHGMGGGVGGGYQARSQYPYSSHPQMTAMPPMAPNGVGSPAMGMNPGMSPSMNPGMSSGTYSGADFSGSGMGVGGDGVTMGEQRGYVGGYSGMPGGPNLGQMSNPGFYPSGDSSTQKMDYMQ